MKSNMDTSCLLNDSGTGTKRRWSRRYVLAVLAMFGFANVYAMRANLSIALVNMSTDRIIVLPDGTEQKVEAEFRDWSSMTQGIVLGSFFYGYICTQILGGHWAMRYGGKTVLLIGVFGTAVLTLLTPPMTKLGVVMLILVRLGEGLLEGVAYPAMLELWTKWTPNLEKTKLTTIGFSGAHLGTVIAMPVSALVAEHLGWPVVFYVFGILALLWCFVWHRIARDDPADDPMISTDELTLLQKETQTHSTAIHVFSIYHSYSIQVIPWRSILSSKAVWAIIAAHFCTNWGFYTMLTNLPRMMKELLGYQLDKAGFASALPFIVMGTLMIGAGQLADYLRDARRWPTVLVRRRFVIAGFVGQAFFLMLGGYAPNSTLALLFLTKSIACGAFVWAGFSVNPLDIAPQFSALLLGLSNTIATLPGMVAPLVVASIVNTGAESEWRLVFWLTTFIYCLGAVIYSRWAQGEVQEWAESGGLCEQFR